MKIRIDNKEVEAENGMTVLDAARKAGICIPTLCHRDGTEPYSSCMVCMVRDKSKNNFIPSCSAAVQDGMDIDASGEEVIRLRKKAVTLLLLEHRAECEAQCRAVCPKGYNIPLMNRLLIAGEYDEAAELIRSEMEGGDLNCITCKAFCENACRRKKIDTPLSIRNTRIFISHNFPMTKKYEVSPLYDKTDLKKKFSSRTGPVGEIEQNEWLKECPENTTRHREIEDYRSAAEEAASCMRCDCRASADCSLRMLAGEFELKDPRGKFINAPAEKKINHKTGLIFENAKCIKCGLCVRAVADSTEEPSLCFINRGFVSIISEPLGYEFDDIPASVAGLCVSVCPTGALAFMKD
ncbi:MAG TPA: 2Fe-2S iron-sulfur cluster-binding protein [Bacteroidales bacterium]|nr:2Fe-2S iron-sulfur cluster-binding protein [Bacteroidales bacterium]